MDNNLFLGEDASISETLKKLNDSAEKVLLVTDARKLIGVVTDGDIRRAVLAGASLDDSIKGIYTKSPNYVYQSEFELKAVRKLLLETKIDLLPIVDHKMNVVDFITWSVAFSQERFQTRKKVPENLPVVIMAGGKGTRLEPVTTIIPKPLVPVGKKTIIEHIMDQFSSCGVKDFYFTLNYLGEMIQAYLNSIAKKNQHHYIYEDDFYGTAGSLTLAKASLPDTFIVSNCDILVDADYAEVINYHNSNHSMLTILSAFQRHSIPYGVIEFKEDGVVTQIHEKPEKTVVINTGVYIVEKKCLDYIPEGKVFHMTDLIESIMQDGGKVTTYPVNEADYIDIGQWDEYRKAVKQFS